MRLKTYHPCSAERQEIRGLNLPGPPWAISTACYGKDLYIYLISYFMSVRLSARSNSDTTGRILVKSHILVYFENLAVANIWESSYEVVGEVWLSVAKCCSVVMVLIIRCPTLLEDL